MLGDRDRDCRRFGIVKRSVKVAISSALSAVWKVRPNASAAPTSGDGRPLIEPLQKPTYTLNELLAQCDMQQPISQEEQDWLDAPPAGREIL
jgi:antitoxin ChpS